jgi:hypothetical protein
LQHYAGSPGWLRLAGLKTRIPHCLPLEQKDLHTLAIAQAIPSPKGMTWRETSSCALRVSRDWHGRFTACSPKMDAPPKPTLPFESPPPRNIFATIFCSWEIYPYLHCCVRRWKQKVLVCVGDRRAPGLLKRQFHQDSCLRI